MRDCNKCRHKKDKCFCPPHLECKAYERKRVKVKHTFEFETNDDWAPEEAACWMECPFSPMVSWGESCIFTKKGMRCPFKN